MSQTILNAAKSQTTTLENALYTSSENVSTNAQAIFKGVYTTNSSGQTTTVKALEEIKQPGIVTTAWTALQTAGSELLGVISSSPLLGTFFFVPPGWIDPNTYGETVNT